MDLSDLQHLRTGYARARNRYRPKQVSTLLIAEGPPCNLDRYFYFEEVARQDSLFLEIMGLLYPAQKQQYLAGGRNPEQKAGLLELFRDDGYFLMDLSELPTSLVSGPLENAVPSLLQRVEEAVDRQTPVILIKSNVYDLCYQPLKAAGFRVIDERMPFPGSGQQKIFREKFRSALDRR